MTGVVLVAGVGNVFLGDDGFGVEVVRRLRAERLPSAVELADYGIRGVHLAYRLLDAPDLLVLVDAVRRGGPPGTLYLIDPEVDPEPATALADGHAVDVASVLAAVRALGGTLPPVRLVGCEPGTLAERMGLGDAVAAAVSAAVRLVRELVVKHLGPEPAGGRGEEASPCGVETGAGTGRS